jgi:hypothetical protein
MQVGQRGVGGGNYVGDLALSFGPNGQGRARCATKWKPALNAFAITFEGRISTW